MPESCSQKKAPIDLTLSRYSLIRNGEAILNDKLLFKEDQSVEFSPFISSLYKFLGSSYRKFFKMDRISKLGFLAAEILLEQGKFKPPVVDEEIAVVLSNSQSSLETDAQFQKTIPDRSSYFPNPGLFVYTLPNLMIGEICIRHSIKGENIFFISQQPDFEFLYTYVTDTMKNTAMRAAITGWIDLDFQLNYQAVLFLVTEKGTIPSAEQRYPFDPKTMKELYDDRSVKERI